MSQQCQTATQRHRNRNMVAIYNCTEWLILITWMFNKNISIDKRIKVSSRTSVP